MRVTAPFEKPPYRPTGRLFALATVVVMMVPLATFDPMKAQAQAQTPARPETGPALPSLAPLVQKVLPAVVNVSATLRPDATNDQSQDGNQLSPFDELLRRFFQQQGVPQPRPNQYDIALGSGFIIDPTGYIVTNGHVVQNAEKVAVIFNDDSRYEARIIGQDALTDLALLKIDTTGLLPFVSWGDSDAAQVGDWVVPIGNPFGLGNTVSYGIISARGRDIHAGPYDDFLQIDVSINRGNSGGPTFSNGGSVGKFHLRWRESPPSARLVRSAGWNAQFRPDLQDVDVVDEAKRSNVLPQAAALALADTQRDGAAPV